jgi:hypothetical protein
MGKTRNNFGTVGNQRLKCLVFYCCAQPVVLLLGGRPNEDVAESSRTDNDTLRYFVWNRKNNCFQFPGSRLVEYYKLPFPRFDLEFRGKAKYGILAFLNDSLTPHKILTLIIKFPARVESSQVLGAQCDTNVIQSMRCADEIYFTTWEYLLV